MKTFLRKFFMGSNLKIKLDADYQKIFKPFYFTNVLFFMKQYNLKNNTASPVVLAYYVAVAILVNTVLAYLFYMTLKRTDFGDSTTDCIYFFIYSLYVLTFMLMTLLNLWTKEANFMLMATLQEIGDVIKTPEDTTILKLSTWTILSLIVLFYTALLTVKLSLETYWVWQRGVFILTTIIFEMEVVHVSFIIIYLVRKLQKWKLMMMSFQVNELDEMTVRKLKQLRSVFERIMMVQCFIRKAFQAVILFHFIMTFFQSLIFVEVLIIWSRRELTDNTDHNQTVSHAISVYGWIIKGLVIETLLCVSCELFYMEIENIRVDIIRKSCQKYPHCRVVPSQEEVEHFCKCICRVVDNHHFKLTACCVFTVDAALPLRFLALIASYIVVLLQFAFS